MTIIGDEADPADYPFLAALGFAKDDQFEHYCGASLLDLPGDQEAHWLLTAKHCSQQKVAVFGEANFDKPFSQMKSSEIEEKYCNADVDLALLYLEDEVDLSGLALPQVPLSIPKNYTEPIELKLAGWGYSKSLHDAPAGLTSRAYCRDKLGTSFHPSFLCTFGLASKAHVTEQDDSGGPVLLDGNLVGVMFAGDSTDMPDVHIEVGHHLDWIGKVLSGDIEEDENCG